MGNIQVLEFGATYIRGLMVDCLPLFPYRSDTDNSLRHEAGKHIMNSISKKIPYYGACIPPETNLTYSAHMLHTKNNNTTVQFFYFAKLGLKHRSQMTYVNNGCSGLILCVCPANERRHYIVTLSLIGMAHTQNDPWVLKGASLLTVAAVNSSDAGNRIFRLWRLIPCLLMPWFLKSAGHQEAWHWLCRTVNMYFLSELISSTWVKPNWCYNSKCEYIFCNL